MRILHILAARRMCMRKRVGHTLQTSRLRWSQLGSAQRAQNGGSQGTESQKLVSLYLSIIIYNTYVIGTEYPDRQETGITRMELREIWNFQKFCSEQGYVNDHFSH